MQMDNNTLRLITVTGPDCPGIIAGITSVLAVSGADIEDVSMTRLCGNFAMMLVAKSSKDWIRLKDDLCIAGKSIGVRVSVDDIAKLIHVDESNIYVSGIGPNRVGIVSSLSALLAEHGANINEMTTRLLQGTSCEIYVIRIEATYAGNMDHLKTAIDSMGQSLGIETRLELLERVDL